MEIKKPFQKAKPGITPSIMMCDPKNPFNVGAAVRAASCFDVKQVWVTGERCANQVWGMNRIPREERMKGFSDVDIILEQQPIKYFENATPVAIELLQNSENLITFEHPENPIYVFGPEDGNVNQSIRSLCHRRVFIPTKHCTNLAAAVYLILYDRLYKQFLNSEAKALPIGEVLAEERGWPANEPMFEKD